MRYFQGWGTFSLIALLLACSLPYRPKGRKFRFSLAFKSVEGGRAFEMTIAADS